MTDARIERREPAGAMQKFADSALLKVTTSFLTLFMVPLIWRIADTMTELRTNGALMELRVSRIEALVPTRTQQYADMHDGIQGLTYRIGELERTCKRIEGR